MTNPTSKKSQRVRFEEVTPTNEIVAYFDTQLPSLIAGKGLPIFPGYDDLDYIQFAYVTLPSGNTVVLGQYENAPEIGVDLYVDFNPKSNSSTIAANIPALVVETLRYLAIPRATAVWFHPDYETEIEHLYSKDGEFAELSRTGSPSMTHTQAESIAKISTEEFPLSNEYEPIDCFYYALKIYTREKLPEYWAMLQHNLGLAYFDRIKDERWRNLQNSIECFHKSLEVFAQDKFPKKWQINQEDLSQSLEALKVERHNLVEDILDRPISSRELQGADLSHVDLSHADLRGANLENANLIHSDLIHSNLQGANLQGANLRLTNLTNADLSVTNLSNVDLIHANLIDTDLRFANLSNANLRFSDLSGANLSGAEVTNTHFKSNSGISASQQQDLIERGAIFEDAPGDRSESRTLVPR
jgi:uncharacterized protein YjbI with pentapeptide repeats